MKKVLIITYYWPPSGGSGVQRWLKMSKYLRDFGWEPIIYTADGGEAPAIDHSLQKDVRPGTTVLKKKIWEPYNFYKKFTGKKKTDRMGAGFLNEGKKKKSRFEGLAIWVRGNLFIPDARKFWIKPSVKYLKNYLKENPVDAIISTGPPHSMHIIARGVQKKLNIPWIADFRDPWTKIDFYDQLKLSKRADRKHRRLEKEVLKNADVSVSVSWNWKEDMVSLGAKKVEVVTNGFDHEDVPNISMPLSDKFTITHIGSMNKDRNPHALWEVLSELCNTDKTFKENLLIQFIGKTDFAVFESTEKYGLNENLTRIDYLAHDEVFIEMSKSQLLLLAINDTPNVAGVIPGKVFEYMAVKRPILAIGPPTADSGRIIMDANAGDVIGFKDAKGIKESLLKSYNSYLSGNLGVDSTGVDQYTRQNLANKYSEILNDLV
jgi:glycosyltransferase involved in cell wall biosynthesis